MKKLQLLILLLFATMIVNAQSVSYEHFALNLKAYDLDTTATALVLQEFGNTSLYSGTVQPMLFDYHVKIKIFNKNLSNICV